jgi:hypothetical protein
VENLLDLWNMGMISGRRNIYYDLDREDQPCLTSFSVDHCPCCSAHYPRPDLSWSQAHSALLSQQYAAPFFVLEMSSMTILTSER